MFNIPFLTRAFSIILLAVGLWLATENTLISAEVLSTQSGASVVASSAIAIFATALEMVFASWFIREDSLAATFRQLKENTFPTLLRLFTTGVGLALVYHFDILTTAMHPRFITDNPYFFSAVVCAFIFGPEACIVVSWLLWVKARDVESNQLKKNNHKDGENTYLRAHREQLNALAKEAGIAKANQQAAARWGNMPNDL